MYCEVLYVEKNGIVDFLKKWPFYQDVAFLLKVGHNCLVLRIRYEGFLEVFQAIIVGLRYTKLMCVIFFCEFFKERYWDTLNQSGPNYWHLRFPGSTMRKLKWWNLASWFSLRGKPNCYGLFCKRIMNFAKMGILLDSTFKRLNSQDKLKALQRTSEYDGWKKMAVFLQMGYFYPSFQVLLFLVFRTSYDFFLKYPG